MSCSHEIRHPYTEPEDGYFSYCENCGLDFDDLHESLFKRVEELEKQLREQVDTSMCRRLFIQEKGLAGAYVDWMQARGIEGEKING